MTRRNLSLLLFAIAFSALCWSRAEKNPYARYLSNTFTAIDEGALERVPAEKLSDAAVRAMKATASDGPVSSDRLFDAAAYSMVELLNKGSDTNSAFIAADQAEPFIADMRQEIGGIGVSISWRGEPPQLTVARPPEPDSPAARAKIRSGDRIVAIDGVPISEIAAEGLIKPLLRMRGAPGSELRLTIERDGREGQLTFDLVREIILVPSVFGDRRRPDGTWKYALPDAPEIAYVRIASFGDRTVDELKAVLRQLSTQGMDALVLDLRDNPGGVLDAAVGVCDLFLPEGAPIVDIVGRDKEIHERFEASGDGGFQHLPIAVLINGESASASEIVAACLQDDDRAVVIGSRSFGKGTVQHAILIEPGRTRKSWLKLTSASYWRPSGANIHRTADAPANGDWGVSPTEGFLIELDDEAQQALRKARADRDMNGDDAEPFEDPALKRAVEYLQQ